MEGTAAPRHPNCGNALSERRTSMGEGGRTLQVCLTMPHTTQRLGELLATVCDAFKPPKPVINCDCVHATAAKNTGCPRPGAMPSAGIVDQTQPLTM